MSVVMHSLAAWQAFKAWSQQRSCRPVQVWGMQPSRDHGGLCRPEGVAQQRCECLWIAGEVQI
jgi:hypothetical protein